MERFSSEFDQIVERLRLALQTAAQLRKDHARLKQEFDSLRERIRATQLDSEEFVTSTTHHRTPGWRVTLAAAAVTPKME